MVLNKLTDYGNDFQIKLIVNILQNNINYLDILNLKIEHFSERLQPLYKIIYSYIEKYNSSPSVNVLSSEFNKIKQSEDNVSVEDLNRIITEIMQHWTDSDLGYVKDEIINFIKQRSLETVLIQSAQSIQTKTFEYNSVLDEISNIMMIGEQNKIGEKFSSTVENRYSDTERKVVATNIPIIDEITNGGFGKGELAVVVAPSGAGKCVGGSTIITIKYNQLYNTTLKQWEDIWNINMSAYSYTDIVTKIRRIRMDELFKLLNIGTSELSTFHPSFTIEVYTPAGYKNIVTLFRTEKQKTVRTYFSNGTSLKTSGKHRLLKENGKYEFVHNLKIGDKIKSDTGFSTIVDKQSSDFEEILYDISVEEVHCYYSNGVVSHNSWVLSKLGYEAFKNGHNVLHYTLELSAQYTNLRYDSVMMQIPSNDLHFKQEAVKAKIKSITSKYHNEIIVKEFPTKFVGVQALLAHVKQLKGIGFEPDIIIVDYADLLISEKYANSDSTYLESGNIYERLRGMGNILGVPIVTASQSHRCIAIDSNVEIENKGIIKIGTVKVGDKIKTHKGFKKIKNVFPITKQPAYKIKLKSGKEIIVSAKHKFPVEDGKFKCINTGLKVGSKLFIENNEGNEGNKCNECNKNLNTDNDSDDKVLQNGVMK